MNAATSVINYWVLGMYIRGSWTCDVYLGFGGKTCHESSRSIACVVFFNEADSWVDEEQHNNTNEILPVRWLSLNCSSLKISRSHTLCNGVNVMSHLVCVCVCVRERERERVTPPLAKTMAMIAAHSMTHDRGFHMKPKNLRNLLSFFSSSLFGPKIWSLFSPSSPVKPFLEHFSCSKTSSIGIRSCTDNHNSWKSTTYYNH